MDEVFFHFSSCFFNLRIICFYILTVIVNFTKIRENSETSYENVFFCCWWCFVLFLLCLPLTRNFEQNPGHLRNFPGIFQFLNFFLFTALVVVGPGRTEAESEAN